MLREEYGAYAANAAWTTCAVIAFNLARAAAVAANLAAVRWASLRTKIINTAGRVATSGRRLDLRLPDGWACEPGWHRVWAIATGSPPLRPT